MALHNPNNWHWVTKNVREDTNELFSKSFRGLKAEEGDVKAEISEVHPLQGSVEVSQRKGKVSAMFMMTLDLDFTGSAPDADTVTGKISLDEIDPTMDTDEYEYTVKLDEDKKEHQVVKDLVQRKIVPELRKFFDDLIPLLIKTHGKDIQHATGANPSSGFASPKYHPEKLAAAAAPSTASQQNKTGAVVNTTTLTDSVEFRTSAEDAYEVFVNPARIAAFTRSPPKVFEGAHPGGKFELFDGNVSGEFLELDRPNRIVQTWRLGTWPAGHFSKLKLEFTQDNVHNVTNMNVTWDGVPIGQEETTKKSWSQHYVKSIMMAFGYGTSLS